MTNRTLAVRETRCSGGAREQTSSPWKTAQTTTFSDVENWSALHLARSRMLRCSAPSWLWRNSQHREASPADRLAHNEQAFLPSNRIWTRRGGISLAMDISVSLGKLLNRNDRPPCHISLSVSTLRILSTKDCTSTFYMVRLPTREQDSTDLAILQEKPPVWLLRRCSTHRVIHDV